MPPKVVRQGQTEKKIEQKQIKEEQEQVNNETLTKNNKNYDQMRTYTALNAGIVAGLFGFSGFSGIITFFVFFFITSYVILLKTKFKPEDFFLKRSDVLFGGLGNDVTLFLMSWIVSHNLVNIL